MLPDRAPSVQRHGVSAPQSSARAPRMLSVLWILAGLTLPAGLLFSGLGCGGAKDESRRQGDMPYAVLDKAFQPLRRDFEDGDGKVRLVGIVAPTCGECIDYAAAVDERLLPQVPGEDFEVFLVWVCAVPPDVEVNARANAERYANPRIHHYWDGSGRIGRAFGRHAGLPEGSAVYGLFYLYGRADSWDPQGKMASEPAGYNAILDGWQPADPRSRCGRHPRLRLPQFSVETLRRDIERLLGEPDPAAGAGKR
jgi:hypothetical protein